MPMISAPRRPGPRTFRRLTTAFALVAGGVVFGSDLAPVSGKALSPAKAAFQAGDLWLVPDRASIDEKSPLGVAVADLAADRFTRALTALTAQTNDPSLGGYALLYVGRAQMGLARFDAAAATAKQLTARQPSGYLADAALWLAADAAENRGDWAASVAALQTLAASRPASPERAWLRLGEAADRAGDTGLAVTALMKAYYDYPLTPEADDAAPRLTRLTSAVGKVSAERLRLDVRRADQLFAAHRWSDARKAYDALRLTVAVDDRPRMQLRVYACDINLKKFTLTRDALRPLATDPSPLHDEAAVYYASALRGSGRVDDYMTFVRAFADAETGAPVEDALNDLATFYILRDDNGSAAAVFSEMYRRFPAGAYAERAAWRSGWWAYRAGDFTEAARVFESAAASLGRVDRRPAFMYWAARARQQLGARDAAADGYRLVVADYRNSYYGRLAQRDLAPVAAAMRTGGPYVPVSDVRVGASFAPGQAPANAEIIRRLLAVGLYDAAIGELRKAEAETGVSPMLEATIAYALNRKGDLRPAITTMRRAYPQFIADGGEALPTEMLAVIFPLTYWDLITTSASAHKLDPYVMAALIAQESTFDAAAHSSADAYGLMQVLPSTGRQLARSLGIRPFSTSKLHDPAVNIRIGTAYFAGLVDEFGDVTLALAAYNAGEQRVSRWMNERPGVGRDEFVEDIPYAETQNYLRRILGTAEDYRALYGHR